MIEFTQTLAFAALTVRPAPVYRPAAERTGHSAADAVGVRSHAACRQHDRLRAWLWAAALLLVLGAAALALLVRGRPALRALWHSYGVGAAGDILSAGLPAVARVSAPCDVPQAVQLPVDNILQNPEMPNGCEITSAAIALQYLGYPADKCVLAADYLPCQSPYYKADPEQVYMGDPFSRGGGYYCLTGPVVTAINSYLAGAAPQGAGYTAVDLSGSTSAELKTVLDRGVPVLVWVTTDFSAPTTWNNFTLPNGQKPWSNLHCLVLTGYDADGFFLADPLGRYDYVTALTFGEVYAAMGSRAVAILPKR